ncbi:MAG: thermonuclease family protein [Novosphingobium sp.]
MVRQRRRNQPADLRFWPETRAQRWHRRARSVWRALRWWLALAILLVATEALRRWWSPAPTAPPPPPPAEAARVHIDAKFTRCGRGRGTYCVIDGDTIRIGARSLRIRGIDAPEVHEPRCPEEARRGEAASLALLNELNAAPFDLIEQPGLRDDYGRELAELRRTGADGKEHLIAETLISSGVVREYRFGPRQPWCPR